MKHRSTYLQCSGDDWQKARMRALVRDEFQCQFHKLGLPPVDGCTAGQPETRLRKLQVHHLLERIHGGTHELSNLLTICRAHHIHIHPHMRLELSAGSGNEFELPLREL